MHARFERAERFELRHDLSRCAFGIPRVDKFAFGLRRRDDANLLHPGRRSGEPELLRVPAEVGRAHDLNRLGQRLIGSARLDLDRLRDALGAGDDGGHFGLDLVEALVALAFGAKRASVDFQFSRAGDLRSADQFRNLGTDLPRLRIERILAKHDQIEMFARQPNRECTGRCQRVRPRERAILKVHSMIHSHRERIDKGAARLRRSHRNDSSLRAVAIFQLDGE